MKNLFKILIICFALAVPLFSILALDLDYDYPNTSESDPSIEQIVTSGNSLPGIIKYYSKWAIIVAVLLVIATLIISGMQYLTSGGRPAVAQAAKGRITNAFLGLAILAASYLILVLINPQLTILSIKTLSFDSGVVLFSETGLNAYQGYGTGGSPQDLQTILDEGEAFFLTSEIKDIRNEFGELRMRNKDNYSDQEYNKVNFSDFQIKAIGFFGERKNDVKIIAYQGISFNTGFPGFQRMEYMAEGVVDQQTGDFLETRELMTDVGQEDMNIIVIDEFDTDPDIPKEEETDFFEGLEYYIDENITDQDQGRTEAVHHPPLSFKIEGTGPGVYLFSNLGEHRYFVYNHDDLDQSDIDFDNQAETADIKNVRIEKDERGNTKEERHDYLAILHSENYSYGNIKMFFEERELKIPLVYFEGIFQENKDFHIDNRIRNHEDLYKKDNKDERQGVYIYSSQKYKLGNIASFDIKENRRRTISFSDLYGKIWDDDKVSSVEVYELARPDQSEIELEGDMPEGFSTCKEVKICNESGEGLGNCISYTPMGREAEGNYRTFTLPMPWYMPVNIPSVITGEVKYNNEDGKKILINADGQADFAQNIRSIYIKGDCLVVLFENSVKLKECLEKCDIYYSNKTDKTEFCSQCWKDDTTGSHSEVFVYPGDTDLRDNQISMCGGIAKGLGLVKGKPCAKAIAVFPLKGK